MLGYSQGGGVALQLTLRHPKLVNTLERAFLLADQHEIDAPHIVLPSVAGDALIPVYRDAKVEFEQHYYSKVMRTAGGNVSLAAKLAQKTRKEVYDALKKLGISDSQSGE